MRLSRYFLPTLKENPAEAEIVSHRLMLRAGMIRQAAAGIYSWLPLGHTVLQNIERIVREEQDRAGCNEVLMPTIQSADIWRQSGRYEDYGKEMLRFKDRHGREMLYGPTNEELITEIFRAGAKSYRDVPKLLYHIQWKFRDEVRPRFGVMRGREFLMKDAYSFHASPESLDETYQVMVDTYSAIFRRLGLDFRAVEADSGAIGGSKSQEFHVLASSGEDAIAFSSDSDYAANTELAEALAPEGERPTATETMQEVATPDQNTIEQVAGYLNTTPDRVLKTLLVHAPKDEDGNKQPLVALVLRGDHTLNDLKAERRADVAEPLTMASDEEIRKALGVDAGSIGPVGLRVPMIVDHAAAHLADFVCGANRTGYHLTGVNWDRDVALGETADLREVEEGDPSPDGHGVLGIQRGIEVGHVFKLGRKYSEAMNATVLDENGKSVHMDMGCYGIGVSRLVAAAIEQNHDDSGITWPTAIAPFEIAIVTLNGHKSERVAQAAEKLYDQLRQTGYDVLLDDRKERPGVKFADMELIGIPHRVVISDRGLEAGTLEYKGRTDADKQDVAADDIIRFLAARVIAD